MEPTDAGARSPLRGDGCARQGRRTGVSGGRLVVADAARWSEVATMEGR